MKNHSLTPFTSDSETSSTLSRRRFVGGALAAAGAPLLAATRGVAQEKLAEPKPAFARKIKLGVVGNGGRGKWIAGLFHKHGGYEIHSVADYFKEVADAAGDQFGVDKARRFSGLSGYKRVIESGIEAIALETPPYFFPEHASAAVEAELHVYMAKPVAVDVPGCMAIAKAGKKATADKRCFLVDYQMPTDPINMDVATRIRDGGLGKLGYVLSYGFSGGIADPPRGKTIENRLRGLIWVNDIAMGCDYIGNYDIHAIDAALWVLGKRPIAAGGHSRILRPDPHGDGRDVCSVLYEFADGLVMNHQGQWLCNNTGQRLTCEFYGLQANATICYWGKAQVRGGPQHIGPRNVENLYQAGAMRNIGEFYQCVTEGRFDNPTVGRAVDGCLTCILGREAAARHTRLTMDELIKESKRLDVDLSGLKA